MHRQEHFWLIICAALIALAGASGLIAPESVAQSNPSTTLHEIPLNRGLFYGGVDMHPTTTLEKTVCTNTRVALVPHHDLATDMIAKLLNQLAGVNQPKVVVVIGPNHTNTGEAMVHTSAARWLAPDGEVAPNTTVVEALVADGLATIDEAILSREHAAYVPIAYVKRYFPEATVVPLIISGYQTESGSRELAQALSTVLPVESLVLGSVDFSHYLPAESMPAKDAVTESLMRQRSYSDLAKLTSDNTDSPQSLITLLTLADIWQTPTMHVVDNYTSATILRQPVTSATSYFSLCFTP